MKFNTRIKVLGMKSSKGDFEGTHYDSTKVYVETSLDESRGTARGFAAAEYVLGDSLSFDKFKHMNFPFTADADMEQITTGKAIKTVMHALTPVQASKV